MKTIAILAAFPDELAPLVARSAPPWKPAGLPGLRSGDAAWTGELGGWSVVAVCAGMGAASAARAWLAATSTGPLDAALSAGWAGALSCGVSAGCAYPVAEVIDDATGESFATASAGGEPARLRLVTASHVVRSGEKRSLARKYQAVLADMEAATIARLAGAAGTPFSCIKAVSDAYTERIPDFSRFADENGHLRMAPLLAHLAVRPVYWPALGRMRSHSRAAAEALAAAITRFCQEEAHAHSGSAIQ